MIHLGPRSADEHLLPLFHFFSLLKTSIKRKIAVGKLPNMSMFFMSIPARKNAIFERSYFGNGHMRLQNYLQKKKRNYENEKKSHAKGGLIELRKGILKGDLGNYDYSYT